MVCTPPISFVGVHGGRPCSGHLDGIPPWFPTKSHRCHCLSCGGRFLPLRARHQPLKSFSRSVVAWARGCQQALKEANRQIGIAPCRERVCQYVYISVVAVSLNKNNTTSPEDYILKYIHQ